MGSGSREGVRINHPDRVFETQGWISPQDPNRLRKPPMRATDGSSPGGSILRQNPTFAAYSPNAPLTSPYTHPRLLILDRGALPVENETPGNRTLRV